MSDPRHETVRVRRSPRIGVFLILGAAAGAVVALVFITISPVDPQFSTSQSLGFLVLLLAPIGALAGGAVAVLLDRRGERRARVVQAERIAAGAPQPPEETPPQHGDDQHAEAVVAPDGDAEHAEAPTAEPAGTAPPADFDR